ncbi:MAG: 50S ribosomal protein L19 [bacterium]
MSSIIEEIEKGEIKEVIPDFVSGDKVKVHVRITEGVKSRIQVFEGVVIRIRKGGSRATFTVRKISSNIGVERIFPFHSPVIEKIEVVSRGRVRRAKLYYLRSRRGKAARIKPKKSVSQH